MFEKKNNMHYRNESSMNNSNFKNKADHHRVRINSFILKRRRRKKTCNNYCTTEISLKLRK